LPDAVSITSSLHYERGHQVKNNQHDKTRIRELPAESLMDLLIAQCSDLEGLLSLARRENVAANSQDFGELFVVFGERAKLGDRLETYHRQVAELRDKLGQGAGTSIHQVLSTKTVQLVVEIQAQDKETTSLLIANQALTTEELARLGYTQRNSLAYLHGTPTNGLNCDRRG
jgi:hypothetical protein